MVPDEQQKHHTSNLLEMQITGPTTDLQHQNLWGLRSSHLGFHMPSKGFLCALQFEDHWFWAKGIILGNLLTPGNKEKTSSLFYSLTQNVMVLHSNHMCSCINPFIPYNRNIRGLGSYSFAQLKSEKIQVDLTE